MQVQSVILTPKRDPFFVFYSVTETLKHYCLSQHLKNIVASSGLDTVGLKTGDYRLYSV